jgi:exosome complex exonuclease DIS3/RRP44
MYLSVFLAIIHFSSKYTYTSDKQNVIRKEASSFIKNMPKILAKTKRLDQKKDMYVILRIENTQDNVILCDVIQYLGEINDPIIEQEFMKLTCTAHWQITKKMGSKFQEQSMIDLTPIRTDYTNMEIYSIDPSGCKDIDDALHCIKTTSHYEIGIHIADVSSYIDENSEINNELTKRVESIYLQNTNPINMIPDELAINHISLLAEKPKRSFSIIIRLNNELEIDAIEFKKTMIQVRKNLTYDEAQEMININETINKLYTIGLHLKKQIEFAFPKNENYDTHQMVAVYMIYANKFVAEKIRSYDPDNVLLRAHRTKTHNIVSNVDPLLLKKYNINFMEQATYQIGSENCNHQGLGLPFYTHFTSPIRRYADIIVHRQLWKVLNEDKLNRQNEEIINLMNFCGKYYKQLERYHHIIQISNNLGIEYDIVDSYITYIDEKNNSIKLYIPKYDLDYDYSIYSYKMKDIVETTFEENSVIIKNNETNNERKLDLFQKIQIKLIASTKCVIKLIAEIIE